MHQDLYMLIRRTLSLCILCLFFFLPFATHAQVAVRDTTILWDHFDYTLDAYYSIQSHSQTNIVTDSLAGYVLENEWLRVTVVPEFGARVVSMVYKPTGQEQLYSNPVAVPYLIGDNIFYNDWLMVYAGIFPTFPEPEHGKYWHYPWPATLIQAGDSAVTISMELQDFMNNPAHPNQYDNGVTGITCHFDVTLRAGAAHFEVDVRLENDATADNYEYWTCITFAPGSEVGNTYTPSESEMIVPIEAYQVGWNPGNWMNGTDEVVRASGPRVQKFDNLAHLSAWEEQGIAYAYPQLAGNYYGVINHTNEVGLFRISSDQSQTPGMKFWAWGDQQGLNADITNFHDFARPYIELWSGVSHEFFTDARLGANEAIGWTETYMPTMGMPGVQYIDGEVAFHYEADSLGELVLYGFSPALSAPWQATAVLFEGEQAVWEGRLEVAPQATEASVGQFNLREEGVGPGTYTLRLQLSNGNGIFHTMEKDLTLSTVTGLSTLLTFGLTQPGSGQLALTFPQADHHRIQVITMQGNVIKTHASYGSRHQLDNIPPGLYIIRTQSPSRQAALRVQVW